MIVNGVCFSCKISSFKIQSYENFEPEWTQFECSKECLPEVQQRNLQVKSVECKFFQWKSLARSLISEKPTMKQNWENIFVWINLFSVDLQIRSIAHINLNILILCEKNIFRMKNPTRLSTEQKKILQVSPYFYPNITSFTYLTIAFLLII